MTAYYNENDPFAAAWLRNLISDGAIAPGEVDERSIVEVQPEDLKGFTQCHFFAGIGVWSYSLRLAGWPDARPVWTGSCPCPSFSAAGQGKGFDDARHLWPDWFRLIRECRPAEIFGEQVDAAVGHGWLDVVQTDLESEAYAIGKALFGACSVGAPHIRKRLYFVAKSRRDGCSGRRGFRDLGETSVSGEEKMGQQDGQRLWNATSDGGENVPIGLADTECDGGRTNESGRGPEGREVDGRARTTSGLADTKRRRRKQRNARERSVSIPDASSERGDTESGGCGERRASAFPGSSGHADGAKQTDRMDESSQSRLEGFTGDGIRGGESGRNGKSTTGPASPTSATRWSDIYWLPCKDGRVRPVPIEPTFFPLVDGPTRNRVGLLRGAGNAIVAPVAEAFIRAFMETENG